MIWIGISVAVIASLAIAYCVVLAVHRKWQNSPEEQKISEELWEEQIKRNAREIELLNLDIFHGVPHQDNDLFDLMYDKAYINKGKACHWEIPTVAWNRIQKMRDGTGRYLLEVPSVVRLDPPDYVLRDYNLLGMPVYVSDAFEKFDLKCR